MRKEQERLDGIKKKELARITNERRRENERRRTQEIKFNREDFEQMRASQTNGRAQGPSGSVSPAVGGEEEPAFSRWHTTSVIWFLCPLLFLLFTLHVLVDPSSSSSSVQQSLCTAVVLVFSCYISINSDSPSHRRGESMRVDPKKHKRTPSFTTRRRTQSFRRHTKNLNTIENLPPVEVDGFLDRKQELQSGGKRATIRCNFLEMVQ